LANKQKINEMLRIISGDREMKQSVTVNNDKRKRGVKSELTSLRSRQGGRTRKKGAIVEFVDKEVLKQMVLRVRNNKIDSEWGKW
jgi:hypothetical protein